MRLGSLLRNAVDLPLYDLNYVMSSERVDLYSYSPSFKRRGLLICSLAFFFKFFKSAFTWQPNLLRKLNKRRKLVVAETTNQLTALEPVEQAWADADLLHLNPRPGARFPDFLAYLTALPFLPVVMTHFLTAEGYHRKAHAYIFNDYWLTYGYYVTAQLLLRKLQPQLVLVSNDHNMRTRTFVKAAQDENVTTCYLQHASVSRKFPPLSFDYAFLDGMDALLKYDDIGAAPTKVFLTGIPKFDAFYPHRNRNPRVERVGICVNMLDPTDKVVSLCEQVRQRFPELVILLRPHPSDFRDWRATLASHAVTLSDAKLELSFEFLRRVDAIVSGESNIILEATLMDVYCVYYDFAKKNADHYGFVTNGLVAYKDSPAAVLSELAGLTRHKPSVRDRAKPYCATVSTQYDGRSAKLIADLVNKLLTGARLEAWERVPGTRNLEAYRLK